MRQVEEADVIKADGAGHLYVVNPFRGLQILDVSNPDAPRLVGRAPILGYPVDMYFAGGVAYVGVGFCFGFDIGSDPSVKQQIHRCPQDRAHQAGWRHLSDVVFDSD